MYLMDLVQIPELAVLNFIYDKITSKIPEKVRNVIIICLFGIIYFLFVLWYTKSYTSWRDYINRNEQTIVGAFLMAPIVILSVNAPLKRLRNNTFFSLLWMIVGAVILLIGCFLHPVGSGMLALAMMMLVVMPALYAVWNNRRDYEKLFDMMATGTLIVGLPFFAYNIITQDFVQALLHGGWDFRGIIDNSNVFASLTMPVIASCLYLICSRRKFWGIYTMVVGIMMMIVICSNGRTELLAATLMIVYYFAFEIKRAVADADKKRLTAMIVTLIITIIGAAAPGALRNTIGSVPEPVIATESNTVDEDWAGQMIANNPILEKANDMTSSRIYLWLRYLGKTNLLGNNGNHKPKGVGLYAHNAVVEMIYRTGIINGLLFFLMLIIAGIRSLALIFKKENINPHHFFTAACIINYCVFAMLETPLFVFCRCEAWMFFVVAGSLMMKEPRSE